MSFTITVKRNTGRTEFYDAGEWFQHEQVDNPSFRIEVETELQPITLYSGDKAFVMNDMGNTVGKIEAKEVRQFVVNQESEGRLLA